MPCLTDDTYGAAKAPSIVLKRTADANDSDAVLAGCFGEDETPSEPHAAAGDAITNMSDRENDPTSRPMRSLPARSGMRPTMSMPPLHEAPYASDICMSDAQESLQADPYRLVDFSAFAAHSEGF